jgi:hypothetical protein
VKNTSSAVRAALDTLAPFGQIVAETAVVLLDCGNHRSNLTAADVAAGRHPGTSPGGQDGPSSRAGSAGTRPQPSRHFPNHLNADRHPDGS